MWIFSTNLKKAVPSTKRTPKNRAQMQKREFRERAGEIAGFQFRIISSETRSSKSRFVHSYTQRHIDSGFRVYPSFSYRFHRTKFIDPNSELGPEAVASMDQYPEDSCMILLNPDIFTGGSVNVTRQSIATFGVSVRLTIPQAQRQNEVCNYPSGVRWWRELGGKLTHITLSARKLNATGSSDRLGSLEPIEMHWPRFRFLLSAMFRKIDTSAGSDSSRNVIEKKTHKLAVPISIWLVELRVILSGQFWQSLCSGSSSTVEIRTTAIPPMRFVKIVAPRK
ncbi:hypothetical protein DFH11DRAFT_1829108 [Phellopilus nigrolimitatus]|nr:hypothetical protein DFH11DRAFT_1829108 [Phellopilus nigrolimitatus]